ncbi:MAG: hypothetical protein JST08_06560 [Actinobacteria bacterium]|nr:hypothetical protein [Actinomycetota bacterium]
MILIVVGTFVGLVIPRVAGAITPSHPPIENISPPSGSTVERTTGSNVTVEFTCPRFTTGTYGEYGWSSYFVEVATNPAPNPEGEFATPFRVGSGVVFPTNVTEDHCKAELSLSATSGILYWRAKRINCEVITSCDEFGPIWSFNLVTNPLVVPTKPGSAPTNPTAPPEPTPPAGASARIAVWTGCGLSIRTSRSSICSIGTKMGAFIKASKEVSYDVCVRFPEGEHLCTNRPQYAEAGTTYVNKITGDTLGRYVITWNVEGRKFTRYVRRVKDRQSPQYRGCRNVKTRLLTGWSVETSSRLGCSGARKIMRKYFKLVEATAQTNGACAQKRSSRGCKIMRYRCFTRYARAANELEGECKGPRGIVWFNELDRGPN